VTSFPVPIPPTPECLLAVASLLDAAWGIWTALGHEKPSLEVELEMWAAAAQR
jgi:hypothetical protein